MFLPAFLVPRKNESPLKLIPLRARSSATPPLKPNTLDVVLPILSIGPNTNLSVSRITGKF